MFKNKKYFCGIIASLFLSATLAQAATVDKTSGVYAIPANGLDKVFILKNTVDISTAADADVYQVLKVGTGTLVLNVFTEIVTPNDAATSSAIKIGDGANVTGYETSVDMKAVAGTLNKGTSTETYINEGGKLYTGEDTIDLTFAVTGTNSAGSVKVKALCVDLN